MMCETRLESHPGRNLAYHAVTGGFVLDEVLRRVTGKDCRQLVNEEIRAPLGFSDFTYGIDAQRVHVESARPHVAAGHVPNGVVNE